jgi:hypothetical protein
LKINITVVILLIILTFTFTFISCSNDSESDITTLSTETSGEGGDTIDDSLHPNLPEMDYGNENFVILNGNVQEWMTISTIYAAEENGDSLNDAIYTRNRAVEEQFRVRIVETTSANVKADATKAIIAGDNSFEFVLLTMADAFAMTLENLAITYDEIPYISIYNYSSDYEITESVNTNGITDCPWWVKNSITDMAIANRVYFAISLFDTTHYDGVRTLFFNKKMASDFGLENLYELVNSGRWTIEEMKTMGLTVAADVNGNGVDDEDDRYGYTSWQAIAGQSLMAGVGAPLSISKNSDDIPIFDLDQEYFISRYEAIAILLNDNKGFKNTLSNSGNHGGVAQFTAGNVLFYNETMSNTKNLRSMDTDFGIIPMPKYNEAQEEYHMVAGNPYFMLVPVTNANLERTGIIMESLAFESMNTVSKAFYDILLMGKIARDNDSENMLNIIFNSLSFYHPIALTYVNSNITNMLDVNNRDIVSYFAANKSAVEKEIETAINKLIKE